jgi:hypothetical protein
MRVTAFSSSELWRRQTSIGARNTPPVSRARRHAGGLSCYLAVDGHSDDDLAGCDCPSSRDMLTGTYRHLPAAPVAAGHPGCWRQRERPQGDREVLQRNGTGAVTQIPKSSKIKDPFQYGIRIRVKTILQRVDYTVSCVARDRKDLTRHRSESRPHMGRNSGVPSVGAPHHAGVAIRATLGRAGPSVLRGCVQCVFCRALLSTWSARKHLPTAAACGASGPPVMLA